MLQRIGRTTAAPSARSPERDESDECERRLGQGVRQAPGGGFWIDDEGYDLVRQVDRKAAARVAKTWKELAKLPGAFEFESEVAEPLSGKGSVLRVGRQRAAGSGDCRQPAGRLALQFDVEPGHGGIVFRPRFEDGTNGRPAWMTPESGNQVVFHAQELEKGSGWGRPSTKRPFWWRETWGAQSVRTTALRPSTPTGARSNH